MIKLGGCGCFTRQRFHLYTFGDVYTGVNEALPPPFHPVFVKHVFIFTTTQRPPFQTSDALWPLPDFYPDPIGYNFNSVSQVMLGGIYRIRMSGTVDPFDTVTLYPTPTLFLVSATGVYRNIASQFVESRTSGFVSEWPNVVPRNGWIADVQILPSERIVASYQNPPSTIYTGTPNYSISVDRLKCGFYSGDGSDGTPG